MGEIFVITILCLLVPWWYFTYIRHRLNKKTARSDLDAAAWELGLRRTGGDVGSYHGRVNGYFVKITADEYIKITIRLKTKIDAWMMRTSLLDKIFNSRAMASSMADSRVYNTAFSFGDRDANRFFHYRYASGEVATALGRAGTSVRLLADLAGKWRWSMGQMTISADRIAANPSRGAQGRFSQSITGRQLKYFLPDLVALAKMWDELPELRLFNSLPNI